ncbi:hypothetical protein [Edaphobacillus lindanitolerans]|uniref:hypothetical protein n=1 Tax=Edaphobacillus lindanitolerans TaxID=550447 RepID=UPI001356424A|nr:hypothetical protein [Edaphobacillus lindanitolerans]
MCEDTDSLEAGGHRHDGRDSVDRPLEMAVYSIGSALLFSLTALSNRSPAFTDGAAWV